MSAVYAVCYLLLLTAALLTFTRIERGRSMLDRILALDVIVATVLGAVVVTAAAGRRPDVVPVLVVLTLVGFVGSVSIARFAAVESADEARILTRDELRQVLAEREEAQLDDAPAVHEVRDVVIAVLDVPEALERTGRKPSNNETQRRGAGDEA